MSVSTIKCEVCQESAGKYRCPRCKLVSCSLPCVKQHKEDKNCNGVRDRTAYMSLRDFDDLQLLSDYRYLEDLQRMVEAKTDNRLSKKLRHLKVLHRYDATPLHRRRNRRHFRRSKKYNFTKKQYFNGNPGNTLQQSHDEKSEFIIPTNKSEGESSSVCPSLKSETHMSWDKNRDVPPMEMSLESS